MPSVCREREDLQGRVALGRLNTINMETKILGMMTRDISEQGQKLPAKLPGVRNMLSFGRSKESWVFIRNGRAGHGCDALLLGGDYE